MDDNKTTITEIHRLLPEIEETRGQLKTIRAQIKDVIEQNDEYKALKTDIDQLASKRSEAKKLLLADRDYQKMSAELEDIRFKLRDLEEILSHHLVEHYSKTQTTEITDATGGTRPVIITAKIGKTEKEF